MNVIDNIMKFQTDRELDKQEYNENNEAINIFEEVFEAWGYDIPKERRKELLMPIVAQCDRSLRTVSKSGPTLHDQIDAYNDIIVFDVGAIMKLGCDPRKTLVETGLEIHSRQGKMVDGKFEKYLDKKHTDKWYKANFNECTLSVKGENNE